MSRSSLALSIVLLAFAVFLSGPRATLRAEGLSIQPAEDAPPAAPLAALGAGFTYQGRLNSSGSPHTGNCDFRFGLFDALSAGAQLGSTQTVSTVAVTDGLFAVTLNDAAQFGANAFDGNARWLEIAVRCPAGSGGYTALSPRQPVTPAPYAITSPGSPYQNVVSVAKSGGDFTSIQSALNSITTNSATNRYLVWVGPGTYSEQVTMKPYVDIEGAGEVPTKITDTGSAYHDTGTVVGANNAELRLVTVENTGGNTYAIAIYNSFASSRLTQITATASGGTSGNYGVRNVSSSPPMTNVTASASGGTTANYGVLNNDFSSPTMTNVTATASGGTGNYGVLNLAFSDPTMTNVTATASGGSDNRGVYNSTSLPTMTNVTAYAFGGANARGVFNSFSSPTMTTVTATASSGSDNRGVYNLSSSPTILSSRISAIGGSSTNYGIYNEADGGSYTVMVNNSQITGSARTIRNDAEFTVRVGASLLDGGAVAAHGGTFTCIGAYDENYAALNATCS